MLIDDPQAVVAGGEDEGLTQLSEGLSEPRRFRLPAACSASTRRRLPWDCRRKLLQVKGWAACFCAGKGRIEERLGRFAPGFAVEAVGPEALAAGHILARKGSLPGTETALPASTGMPRRQRDRSQKPRDRSRTGVEALPRREGREPATPPMASATGWPRAGSRARPGILLPGAP